MQTPTPTIQRSTRKKREQRSSSSASSSSMAIPFPLLLIFLSLHPSPSSPAPCPVDLAYVNSIPWDSSSCETNTNRTQCCQTLLSLFGIAIAENLKRNSFFQFANKSISSDCLLGFRNELRLPAADLVPLCFPTPEAFTLSPGQCAGLRTKEDWAEKLGPTPGLNRSCSGDLSDLTSCNSCVDAGVKVLSRLVAIDGNSSDGKECWYFTVLYAAGVVSSVGPTNPNTASCIFGLQLKPVVLENSRKRWSLLLLVPVVGLLLLIVLIWGFVIVRLELTGRKKPKIIRAFVRPNTGAVWFKISELEKATDGFSPRNLIGSGGFGIVYKGVLPNGDSVAVKRFLNTEVDDVAEDDSGFRKAIEISSNMKHKNLLPLRGWCVVREGPRWRERYLVYDYMENGNLHDFIFHCSERKKPSLGWPQRKNIMLDIAKGLAYLHYGSKPAIYHRDIKATNILLDQEMNARIADFGLAKEIKEGQSHLTTRVAGTQGYLAPEYALYGQLTEKSDVYSFGVLVLEMMSGRKALDTTQSSRSFLITDWAWTLVKSGRAVEVIEKGMRESGAPKALMERFVLVGILCSHVMAVCRPTILESLKMLEGDLEIPSLPDRPLPLTHIFTSENGYDDYCPSPSSSSLSIDLESMLR